MLNREWIGFRQTHKNANAPHPSGLLRVGRERPCGGGAAETPDELAPPHGVAPSCGLGRVAVYHTQDENRAARVTQSAPLVVSGWGQTEKSGRSTGRSALPPTPDMFLHRPTD